MMLKLNFQDTVDITTKISEHLAFDKELPQNVFKYRDCVFYFIERPMLDNDTVMASLIDSSTHQFCAPVIVKYLGEATQEGSCLSFSGKNTLNDLEEFEHGNRTFFDGTLDYPIVLCSRNMEWLAIESACDELAVIAVKREFFNGEFKEVIHDHFISIGELAAISKKPGPDGTLAQTYLKNFGITQQ
ncbi:hypothetical protein AB7M33_003057 [Pseudomonas sp. Y3 TE3536]